MNTSTAIELELYRGKILRTNIANGAFQDACKAAARHAARLERIRLVECNGIEVPQGYGKPSLSRSRTDAEQALADRQEADSRQAMIDALRPFLSPGCVWKFYSDPRAPLCRISNKQNTRDAFLGN